MLEPNDIATFQTPSGGGMFSSKQRNPERIEADLISGILTPKSAQRIYGYSKTKNQK
jgi:N-methylhydantoinase B/oxoprolinase/acetone carboxylase alpha subunit